MDTRLLCTFSSKMNIHSVIAKIIITYNIAFDRIYILGNENNDSEVFCTYNVHSNNSTKSKTDIIKRTISIHRKKQTNTLYTINALNEIIKELNDGILDKSFPIPWDEYQNTLLITNDKELRRINTFIFDIVELPEVENNT